MKKLFLFAAAAAMFAACSETEVLDNNAAQEALKQGGVKFDVYTQRNITRGGTPNDITNDNIGAIGFGVFGYYTPGEEYSTSATPNFMYNQRVYTPESPASLTTKWYYEPVKYWPNEYGDAAISDEVDMVTFFAYAPWTKFEPTTGEVDVTDPDLTAAQKDSAQNYNIISVNKNTATGDPIIKYVVDTNPATSVDLLFGVVAGNAADNYSGIDGNNVVLKPGFPFMNLVKPNDPVNDKLVFNLKHALAKVRFTIDYVADQYTPKEGTFDSPYAYDEDAYADGIGTLSKPTEIIAKDTTRIWVRQFKITGWAGKGALNLNNSDGEAGEPRWLDFDGVKELTFPSEGLIFQDGLKDGAEGQGKIDKGESLQGLHPSILESAEVNTPAADGKIYTFNTAKNYGVGPMTVDTDGKLKINKEPKDGTVLLFGGDPTENGGYFYVIPSNDDTPVDVTLSYDVETIDPALAGIFSDNLTKGSSIENIITKEAIFGNNVGFEAGKQYDVNIHIGMTSVKISATVTDWVENGTTVVNLPNNQDPYKEPTAQKPHVGDSYAFTSKIGDATYNGVIVVNELTETYAKVTVTSNPDNTDFVGRSYFIKIADAESGKEDVALYANDALTTEVPEITVTIGAKTSAGTSTAALGDVYAFTSAGGTGDGAWTASGKVKIIAVTSTYIKVQVTENSIEGWVDNTYYVHANASGATAIYTNASLDDADKVEDVTVTIGAKQ